MTQERLARTNPASSPICKFRGCTQPVVEDQCHALVTCDGNNGAGHAVINCLRRLVPGLTNEAALRLDVQLEEEMELPFVWFCAAAFQAIWELRQGGHKV